METRFGTLDADAGIDDVRSATHFAFMGAVEARHGRWGIIGDLVYSDLSERKDAPFDQLFSKARVETELTMTTFYGSYRSHEDARIALDILGGVRAVWLDFDVALEPGVLRARSFDLEESWVDPVLGSRARFAVTDRWFATALADIGGFGFGSDLSWQVLATVGYQFNDRWSVQGGWRQIGIETEIEGRDVELDPGGPILGFTARF